MKTTQKEINLRTLHAALRAVGFNITVPETALFAAVERWHTRLSGKLTISDCIEIHTQWAEDYPAAAAQDRPAPSTPSTPNT